MHRSQNARASRNPPPPGGQKSQSSHANQDASSSRPTAKQLVILAREYHDRVPECENRRRQSTVNTQKKRKPADQVDPHAQSKFIDRIMLAGLEHIWDRYLFLHHGADYRSAEHFLNWAKEPTRYPRGEQTLRLHWENAAKGITAPTGRVRHNGTWHSMPPPFTPPPTAASRSLLTTKNAIILGIISSAALLAAAAIFLATNG